MFGIYDNIAGTGDQYVTCPHKTYYKGLFRVPDMAD